MSKQGATSHELPPLQPLAFDDQGVIRFEANPLVRFLLDEASAGRHCDLNRLAWFAQSQAVPARHQEQLAMLIGYSLSGFSELSYVRDVTYEKAEAMAKRLTPRRPRVTA